jgi:hypothetical protein
MDFRRLVGLSAQPDAVCFLEGFLDDPMRNGFNGSVRVPVTATTRATPSGKRSSISAGSPFPRSAPAANGENAGITV